MKLLALFTFFVLNLNQASAATKLACMSWMNYEIEFREAPLSEYETAHIQHDQGDWAYTADVFEGKLNYLTVHYKPLKVDATSRSLNFPLTHLSNSFEIDGKQASVDCDLK